MVRPSTGRRSPRGGEDRLLPRQPLPGADDFRAWLRGQIAAFGVRPSVLGQEAGLSKNTIRQLLSGSGDIGLNTARALEAALEIRAVAQRRRLPGILKNKDRA